MKKLFLLLICFLFTVSIAYADKPNILIRKSDNKVIGVGYSKFEGVKNIATEYEVREIEPSDIQSYSDRIQADREKERKVNKDKEKVNKDKAIAKLKKLGLTDEEIEAIVK